jgi:ADP-ribosyl-[dinitrogen reductase] hydrolase
MLGAIIGDIVGSRFEFRNHRSKEFDLFTKECFTTDDSVMTLAVAKAIMETENIMNLSTNGDLVGADDSEYHRVLGEMTVKYMQKIGRRYPDCGYGGMFARWLFRDHPRPYNSYGNGAAMRIGPAGYVASTEMEAINLSRTITEVTHNHVEGIKGAEATTVAIFMAREGCLLSEIKDKLTEHYYPIDFTIDEIRPSYQFNETCQGTVPQALACFFESTSFEDAIRTAIFLGGDSDTIAAITGAIAQAYYGIPENIRNVALTYLNPDLRAIVDEWDISFGQLL